MNEQALPDLGLSSDRMLEVEVALRFAAFLLSLPRSGSIASVAIDGASLKVRDVIHFDIAQFMTGTGWEQVKEPQVGRNTWTGTYRGGDKTIRVHSRAGGGDVVARVNGCRIIAACQKSSPVRRLEGPEAPLLTIALGQALLFDVATDDIVVVAVPDTPAFRRLADVCRERPLLKRAGIQLALVHRNGAVSGLDV